MANFLIFVLVFLQISNYFVKSELLDSPIDVKANWLTRSHLGKVKTGNLGKEKVLADTKTKGEKDTNDTVEYLATHLHQIGSIDRKFDNPKFEIEGEELLSDLIQI